MPLPDEPLVPIGVLMFLHQPPARRLQQIDLVEGGERGRVARAGELGARELWPRGRGGGSSEPRRGVRRLVEAADRSLKVAGLERSEALARALEQQRAGGEAKSLLGNDGIAIVQEALIAMIQKDDVQRQVATQFASAQATGTVVVGFAGADPATLLAGAVAKVTRFRLPGARARRDAAAARVGPLRVAAPARVAIRVVVSSVLLVIVARVGARIIRIVIMRLVMMTARRSLA